MKGIQNGTNRNACRGLNSPMEWKIIVTGSLRPEISLATPKNRPLYFALDIFRSFNLHFSLVCAVKENVS